LSKNIGAIVSSRYSSSRLPGKALYNLGGYSTLGLLLERIASSDLLTHTILATSTDKSDDLVEFSVRKKKCHVFRGPLNDVVCRYAGVAKKFNLDYIVRLTGDNPFVSGKYIDDYISQIDINDIRTLYSTRHACPKGLNIEIFSSSILYWLNDQRLSKSDREHLTSFLYTSKSPYKVQNLDTPFTDFDYTNPISLSIDSPEDYINAIKIIDAFNNNLLEVQPCRIFDYYREFIST